MGDEMLEIVKLRKVVIFTSKTFIRSVCSHPFLVGLLCLLVFLYRSSPFVFSLLVSASPVLVCTGVLLGTLLSFGQPNIPEIERDEKASHEIVYLKTGVSGEAVIEKSERYYEEKFNGKRGVVIEQSNGVDSSDRTVALHRGVSVDSTAPLIEERPRDSEIEGVVVAERGSKILGSGYEQKNDINDERLGYTEPKTDDEDLDMENDKSPSESFDSEMVNVDSLDSPPGSPWKHVVEREEQEEEEEDDEHTDSGSDQAESSSPDASMADIMPMLDELHPLLEEDTPDPVPLSHDGSDAASERSLKSSDRSSESDDNMEKDEQVDVADEDNDDPDDEDEGQGNGEGKTKSAITWTKEDQKNLMDLGSLELERNQRLESLIARRRARKSMRIMAENLIDLESTELPFSVPPISTARNNPFDLPHDSYDEMGLPPIPGSAPSVLLARRNPFDLPYDSSEEKPDLLGDNFQQEITAVLPKEPFFRRHESFNVGPSFFGPSWQERQDDRLRPYFVAERMDSEGAGYSSFQRQSSGLSDSKASSVPETDSVDSAGDDEEKNLEENISLSTELLSPIREVELRDSAGDLDDKNSREDISHESELISVEVDNRPGKEDISQEQVLISNVEHVGHGSQTSEEPDALELGEEGKRSVEDNEVVIGFRHMENDRGETPLLFEEACVASPLELDSTKSNLTGEAMKQVHRSDSNSFSSSEVGERIFSEREGEGFSSLEEQRENIVEDACISIPPSLEESHFNMTIDSLHQKEPVYDSSPPDLHFESEIPPTLIKRAVCFAEKEPESFSQNLERNSFGDMDGSALIHRPLDESHSSYMMSIEASDSDNSRSNISGADQVSESANGTELAEFVVNDPSSGAKSSQRYYAEGDFMDQHMGEYVADQSFHSVDKDINLMAGSVPPLIVDSMVSPDQNLARSQAQRPLSLKVVLQDSVPFTGTESSTEQSIDQDLALQPELGQGLSLFSNANAGDDVLTEPVEKQISAHNDSASQERLVAEYCEELVFLDKSVDEASSLSRQHHGEKDVAFTHEEMMGELSSTVNADVPAAQELVEEVSPNISSPTSPESISVLSEAYESRSPEGYLDEETNCVDKFGKDEQLLAVITLSSEETVSLANLQDIDDDSDGIKEIDDALLSELDAVGDFSIKELVSSSIELEKHATPIEEGSLSSGAIRTSNTADVNPNMQLVEARSPENAEVPFEHPELSSAQMRMKLHSSEILSQGHTDEAGSSRLPVLEAQTILDIDSAFKQASNDGAKIEEPKIIELFSSGLALKRATFSEFEHHKHHDGSSLSMRGMEFPIPEARRTQDSNLDDNQSQEGNIQDYANSVHDGLLVKEFEDLDQYSSESLIAESKYLNDHGCNLKQASENQQKEVLRSNSVNRSPEFEENEAVTVRYMQSIPNESGLDVQSCSGDENQDAKTENPETLEVAKEGVRKFS